MRARKRESGHTMIEVMMSAVVFTIGALGLLALFIASSRGLATADRLSVATVLARQKLSELTYTQYDLVATGQEATNIDGDGAAQGTFGSDAGSDGWFARSWTVTVPESTVPFKSIQVDVEWYDKSMKMERNVSLIGGVSAK